MTRLKQLQRCAAFAGSFLLAAAGAQAAGNFTVQNGTWIVTSENNGEPGRGMAIDVQDGILGMQVYNYESSGQPTFHLTTGPMDGNHYSGILYRYKSGRYFGSGPLDGVEDGQTGGVQIDFNSASTGTVQFPGEPPLPMERFNFDMIPPGQLVGPAARGERWLMAELDDSGKPVNALLVNTGAIGFSPDPKTYPTLTSVQSFRDGNTTELVTCAYDGGSQRFSCPIKFPGNSNIFTLNWSKHLEGMSGTMTAPGACNFSPCIPTTHKVVGMRLGLDLSAVTVNAQMDAPSQGDMYPPYYYPAPDPGTWIVTSELSGKPGRGMAIDVQYGTLGMQVYNYEKSGAATFHLALAPYKDGQASGHLKRYEGGRSFGGPAQSGHEVADVGEVKLKFNTPKVGTIEFPGESPQEIRRFEFNGATDLAPESLFGGWMMFDPQSKQLRYYTLNAIDSDKPDSVTGTGALLSILCRYVVEPTAFKVLCEDRTPSSWDEFWFSPVNGRAVGRVKTHGVDNARPVYVLRVKDRNGNLAGLGKF